MNGTYPDPYTLGIVPGTTQNVDPSSAWPIAGSAGTVVGTGTGQHGVVPQTGGYGTMGSAFNNFWLWLNQPLTQPISAYSIFLLVGSVLIAIILWNLILYHIRIAAESL